MTRRFKRAAVGALLTLSLCLLHPNVIAHAADAPSNEAIAQMSDEDLNAFCKQMRDRMNALDFDGVAATLDQLQTALGEKSYYVLTNRFRLLLKRGDYDEAYHLAAEAEADTNTSARTFNELALILTDTANLAERDLIVAKRFARRAMSLSGDWCGYENNLARAYFVNGEYAKAVETEQHALDRAPATWRGDFTRTLAKYQKAADEHPAPATQP